MKATINGTLLEGTPEEIIQYMNLINAENKKYEIKVSWEKQHPPKEIEDELKAFWSRCAKNF
ncbi:hypothetical protein A616_16485 [Brevibacillus brevis X23]|nr:hypothetical protein A616_16485 [Brevibacillus brevis X23]